MITIALPNGGSLNSLVNIAQLSPAVFTADETGKGVFAGQVLYVHADDTVTLVSSANFDASRNAWVPLPIDMSTSTDRVYLILCGSLWDRTSACGDGVLIR